MKSIASRMMDAGYDAGLNGQSCNIPIARKVDMDAYEKGWNIGHSVRILLLDTYGHKYATDKLKVIQKHRLIERIKNVTTRIQ